MKKILYIKRSAGQHWVGDGFPVRNIFHYNDIAKDISPFLLMDYAGPTQFPPSAHIRGVGPHPHRGFETVSIVYHGEVEHRDSAGAGGLIGPGDVQWMTAASGLVHEEMHGKTYAKNGGPFEMVQLWVNLPQKYKMSAPKYQAITSQQIPSVELTGNQGQVRVIAGDFFGTKGPASTFSPINLWDIRLTAGAHVTVTVPTNHTCCLFLLRGEATLNDSQVLAEAEMALFEPNGSNFAIETKTPCTLLMLGGEPLNEPFIGHGPFVMSNEAEILQAFQDYKSGKLGVLLP